MFIVIQMIVHTCQIFSGACSVFPVPQRGVPFLASLLKISLTSRGACNALRERKRNRATTGLKKLLHASHQAIGNIMVEMLGTSCTEVDTLNSFSLMVHSHQIHSLQRRHAALRSPPEQNLKGISSWELSHNSCGFADPAAC